MSKQVQVRSLMLGILLFTASVAFGATPKLLILEHFTDYLG